MRHGHRPREVSNTPAALDTRILEAFRDKDFEAGTSDLSSTSTATPALGRCATTASARPATRRLTDRHPRQFRHRRTASQLREATGKNRDAGAGGHLSTRGFCTSQRTLELNPAHPLVVAVPRSAHAEHEHHRIALPHSIFRRIRWPREDPRASRLRSRTVRHLTRTGQHGTRGCPTPAVAATKCAP